MVPVLLVLFLLALLAGVWYAYRTVFFSPVKGRRVKEKFLSHRYDPYRQELTELSDALAARPFETVRIPSQEGLELYGRYYETGRGGPVVLCFHGYRSNPMADFAAISDLLTGLGQDLLIVDQRAHGNSQGRTITFGIRERRDVQSWAWYAAQRWPDRELLLYGVSMGGASVLMAADLAMPENVRGIVADCPYSEPKAIISRVAAHQGKNPKFRWPLIRMGAAIFGGFPILETTAAVSAAASSLPILILHGEADLFVPPEMSAQIAQAAPKRIRRFTFPGAEHVLSIMTDPERYEACVSDFCNDVLSTGGESIP